MPSEAGRYAEEGGEGWGLAAEAGVEAPAELSRELRAKSSPGRSRPSWG